MTVYKNSKAHSDIRSVEFTETSDHKLQGFFYLRSAQDIETVKKQLSGSGLRCELEAQTSVVGAPVLIMRFDSSQHDVLQWLGRQGHKMVPSHQQKSLDPWIIRSVLGFGGQTLQLTSSLMRPNGRIDPTLFIFATANMTANVINLMYKGQDIKDPHQLRFLKEKYNRALTPQFSQGEIAISVEDDRKALRETDTKAKPIDDYLRRYSVNVGELGLRYLGAFGMVLPYEKYVGNGQYANNWWGRIFKGKLPELNSNPLRQWTGLLSIGGKTLALGSKVEDPYNPGERSWLDGIREKFTFVTGGLVEAGAFSLLAYDAFFKTRIPEHIEDINKVRGIKWPKKIANWLKVPQHENGMHLTRDWLGGVGAAMFVTGYIVRSWAKYGERHVDMDELYAHVSDTLAKLPPEKIPQLLAETAADIKNHFKDDSALDFGTIYTALANDLKRYHHIDVVKVSSLKPHDSEPVPALQEKPGTHIHGPAQAMAPEVVLEHAQKAVISR